jgi:hypothetical protein
MRSPTLRPQPENVLERLIYDARASPPAIEWGGDPRRWVEWLGEVPVSYNNRSYAQGEQLLVLVSIAQTWDEQRQARVICGGRIDSGHVKVRYGNEIRPVPLIKPWNLPHPEHPEAGPVRLVDSDLFLRCAVRHWSEQFKELFDFSRIGNGPCFQFFTDYATLWHRVEGRFCLGPSPLEAPVWGDEMAPLHVYFPQIPK